MNTKSRGVAWIFQGEEDQTVSQTRPQPLRLGRTEKGPGYEVDCVTQLSLSIL